MKASIRKRIEAAMQPKSEATATDCKVGCTEHQTCRDKQPTPEPRAIIRCRDCFFWRMEGYYGPASPMTGNCHLLPPNDRGAYGKTTPEDWCSLGESK